MFLSCQRRVADLSLLTSAALHLVTCIFHCFIFLLFLLRGCSWSQVSCSHHLRRCWGRFSLKIRRSTTTTGPRVVAAYDVESRGSSRHPTMVQSASVWSENDKLGCCTIYSYYTLMSCVCHRLSSDRRWGESPPVQWGGEAGREDGQRLWAPQVPRWVEEVEWVVDLERLGVCGWFCIICCCHIPPGGEGESEEDDEDEPVTDLKKPNTDEVRGTMSSTHDVWLANGPIDGSVVCASFRVLPAVRWTPRRRCQLSSTTLNLSNSRALRWQPVSVCVGEMKMETESSRPC